MGLVRSMAAMPLTKSTKATAIASRFKAINKRNQSLHPSQSCYCNLPQHQLHIPYPMG